MEDNFLGHPCSYWLELGRKADELRDGTLSVNSLIKENGKLRAKVGFYESRLDQINEYRNIV